MLGNLLLRTEYSFMQSLCALKDVVNRSKDAGYEALAIVDFGNLHGGYKFYKECVKNRIKPIIGIEININKEDFQSSIALYAMDNFGYHNLLNIASRYKINHETLDISYLEKYGLGILGIIQSNSNAILNHNNSFISQIKESLSKLYVGIDRDNLMNIYSSIHQFALDLKLE